jgi:periplasmic divalent cation tolerance protein
MVSHQPLHDIVLIERENAMKFVMLYVTVSNKKEANKIGAVLVKERLAACANIIDRIQSVYWWKGNLEKGAESLLVLKTKQVLAKKAISRIKALHSYDCPCITEFTIVGGNPAFLKWISDETL